MAASSSTSLPTSIDSPPLPRRSPDNNDDDDNHLLSATVHRLASPPQSRVVRIKAALVLHFVILAALECLVLVADLLAPALKHRLHFLVYLHVTVWLLQFAIRTYLQRLHLDLRRAGLLDLHRHIKSWLDYLFHTHSFFKVALLFALNLVDTLCTDPTGSNPTDNQLPTDPDPVGCRAPTSSILAVQALTTLEVVVGAAIAGAYYYKTHKHSRLIGQSVGGVESEVGGFLSESVARSGFGDDGGDEVGVVDKQVDELVEAQSEEIGALKAHNAALSRRIVKLQARLLAERD